MRDERTLKKRICGKQQFNSCWMAVFVVVLFCICGNAGAFEIPTGNEDFDLRWDNTLRYSFGLRVFSPDEANLNSLNYDDSDRNFSKGCVTNRLDILSEFDIQYKKAYGVRLSAAGWYDQRYRDPMDNQSLTTSNHIENGSQAFGLPKVTKRMNAGPDGEILDAFVYGQFDFGLFPLNIKVGRHVVYWGESLLLQGAINGISYSQMPVDAAKGLLIPGAEVKELFMPIGGISAQIPIGNTFAIAAQWFWEWQGWRFPESGSYMSPNDAALFSGEAYLLAPGVFLPRGHDAEPNRNDWGIMVSWSPDFLGGKVGLYYRNFSDKMPQVVADLANMQYYLAYASNIDLYGISLTKQIFGIGIGAELSYRHNMPLVSNPLRAIVGVQASARPLDGEIVGARGDTWHAVLNGMYVFQKSKLWDQAIMIVEGSWSHTDHINSNAGAYMVDPSDDVDQVSDHCLVVQSTFTPTWYKVFPSIDFTVPLALTYGVHGNSPLYLEGYEHGGSYSLGVGMDLRNKYKFDLSWVGYFGERAEGADGSITHGGYPAVFRDRDMVTLTIKTTF